MITAIIGLASSAITAGIKKSTSKIEEINNSITVKKIEELTNLGLIPGNVQQESIAEIVSDKPNNILIIGAALIAALFLLKK